MVGTRTCIPKGCRKVFVPNEGETRGCLYRARCGPLRDGAVRSALFRRSVSGQHPPGLQPQQTAAHKKSFWSAVARRRAVSGEDVYGNTFSRCLLVGDESFHKRSPSRAAVTRSVQPIGMETGGTVQPMLPAPLQSRLPHVI